MIELKEAIFRELKEKNPELVELDFDALNHLVFQSTSGLRLTYSGFILLKKVFTAYSFEIPITIKTKHRYAMSKLTYPYFFTSRRLILFSEADALMVKLCGGVDRFLETYTKELINK